jgi:hypothetical protein
VAEWEGLGSAMRNYAVLYKTEADPEGRLWPVGPFPDRNLALDIFNNSTARQKNIGPFTFEETSEFLPHYNLVEREPPNGPEILYPLYKALTKSFVV